MCYDAFAPVLICIFGLGDDGILSDLVVDMYE